MCVSLSLCLRLSLCLSLSISVHASGVRVHVFVVWCGVQDVTNKRTLMHAFADWCQRSHKELLTVSDDFPDMEEVCIYLWVQQLWLWLWLWL